MFAATAAGQVEAHASVFGKAAEKSVCDGGEVALHAHIGISLVMRNPRQQCETSRWIET